MAQLPFRATTGDIVTFCGYLQSKPTGATVTEAKAVLDATILDARKIAAYKMLGLVDDSTGKMRLTERALQLRRTRALARQRRSVPSSPKYLLTAQSSTERFTRVS